MIARGYQFQPEPDPFVQYGQMQQLEQNRQTNALNQMKMQEMQRGMETTNALNKFLPGLNESNRSQLLGYGAAGQGVYKTLLEGDTQQRLRDQATSQAALNKSNILKNVVAQTSDAVARLDPNDAAGYMALRKSVLDQYPDLTVHMPEAFNADVQQRLLATAASVLEANKPELGFTLSPGQTRYPRGYMGVVTAPAAAAAAAAKPPEKLEIMRALGYSMDAAGDAAYEAAKRAAPTVSAPPVAIGEMRALGIPETPEGFAYYNELKTKTPVVAPEPTTNEIKNAKAIALGAGPEGSAAYNQSLQTQLLRLTAKNESVAAPPSMVAEYTFAKTPGGGNFKGTYQQFVTARAAAGRAPAQPRAEPAPVAVVDPVTGKPVLVAREKSLGMTPAAAMESLPPKEIQKREAALPQATSAVKGFESKSSKFIADLTALRDDPGLENITGPVFGRTGSVSQAGSRAQALYDKVVAKGGFQALQDLRDASKTGGALGNVSNQEGKQLTASFAAIDRRQNAEDVRAAINQAIEDIQGTKTRMREAYDSTYAYKSGGESQTSKPASAAPNIDALLNKYK
jgi:hypothetical protein